MSYQRLLYLASREAEKSCCKHKLGAIAITNGQIVSKGFNRCKSTGKKSYRRGEMTIHAEQLALNRTGGQQIDYLFVVRITQKGFSMAMPCQRCVAHAKRAGVKYIYYTDWYGEIQKFKV